MNQVMGGLHDDVLPECEENETEDLDGGRDELAGGFYVGRPGARVQCPSCSMGGRVDERGRFRCGNCGLDNAHGARNGFGGRRARRPW